MREPFSKVAKVELADWIDGLNLAIDIIEDR